MRKQRETSAYHEAGHAVACWVLGMEIESVDIHFEADTQQAGCCSWVSQYKRLDEDRLLLALAGPAAEMRRFPHRRWFLVLYHPDMAVARDIIENSGDCHSIDEWLRRAQKMIRENWQRVEAIATALLRHDELTGVEVKNVLEALP